MTIEVPEQYEQIIRQAVGSGAFKSPEDALCHALELLKREQSRVEQEKAGPCLPDDLDPAALAKTQGVGVIDDPDAGAAESWPQDESIDDWLADLRALRGQGTLRKIP